MSFSQSDIEKIQAFGQQLGFIDTAVTDTDLSAYHQPYHAWIQSNYHADMHYMTKHGDKRLYPEQLIPETQSIIVVTYNYFNQPYNYKGLKKALNNEQYEPVISQYAVGRDYHKVIKNKLKKLTQYIQSFKTDFQYRIFTDSAPVLEKPIAEKAGLGYIGKNSLLLHPEYGSFIFIGIIYCNQTLPVALHNEPVKDLCGSCNACIKICPTNAIVADKIVDSRKCISYLTIENKGFIPPQYRSAIGTRIYGCDDCQAICPINKNSKICDEDDFFKRSIFKQSSLLDLFNWDETTFLKYTQGSAIRRIGYHSWIRNLAVALGNSHYSEEKIKALKHKRHITHNDMVAEHIDWAVSQLWAKRQTN